MKRHFFFFRHGDRAGIDPESGISELGVCQAHRLERFLSEESKLFIPVHCFHFVLDDGKWQFIEEFEPEIMQKC